MSTAIIDGLKRRGVNVFSANDQKTGLTDEEQLAFAIELGAIIFTHDPGFLRMVSGKRHIGIVFSQQHKLSMSDCIRKVKIITETKTIQQMKNKVLFL